MSAPRTFPVCDPIRHAGELVCRRCGAVAWPVEATWLTVDRILCVYEPECAHAKRHVRIVTAEAHAQR